MNQAEIIATLKSGGVLALGKKLRPGVKIKRKSLILWTRGWLRKSYIKVPPQVRGRKPAVPYQPDPYEGGIKPKK
jgi:hypothetical protein